MYLEEKVPLTLTTTEVAITFSASGSAGAADNHKYQKLFTILRTNVDLVFVVY